MVAALVVVALVEVGLVEAALMVVGLVEAALSEVVEALALDSDEQDCIV